MAAPEPVDTRVGAIDDHIGTEGGEELGALLTAKAEDAGPEVHRHLQAIGAQ
jgi:hypothetical protein